MTQNFDTLATTGTAATLPNGWYLNETGTSANADGSYTAGTGASTAGDTYSFGAAASSERALGSVTSGTLAPSYGVSLTNNTGATITQLAVSYTGEEWRLGTAGRTDRLDAQISTDATSLTSGTYTNVDPLDFSAPDTAGPVGARDGNAAADRTAISAPITGLNIPNGASFWLRWVDLDASGNDDGLAIDDVSVTPLYTAPAGGVTRIDQIQGAAHRSPLAGTVVTVEAIVTAIKTGSAGGFYLEEETADQDANLATSEGTFVFTTTNALTVPKLAVGDLVRVSGTVTEFRPGGATSTNLTTTELAGTVSDALMVNVLSSGNPLPPAVVIGAGGRVPPAAVIDSGTNGDVELGGTFDAVNEGLDFYESLEGMRVQVNNAVAVSPTTSNGEIAVLADNGAGATGRTPRGGIVVGDGYADFNPERVILDDGLLNTEPAVNVGDRFETAVVGVLDYSFGNYKLEVSEGWPTVASGGLTKEITTLAAPRSTDLNISSINVQNLSPADTQAKYDRLAQIIVTNLQAPDIVGVEEIQDNSGETNDGVVVADQTFAKLLAAVTAAGGPSYSYRSIEPVNNQDGGVPGGNIRVGLLFRSDRGLAFVDRPGGTSTAAVSVVDVGGVPQLSFSPGRVQPGDGAFSSSRKPLAAELTFNGRTLFVVVNHFNSKGGDQPLFGRFQPPARSSEVQRLQQAAIVNAFVDSILAVDRSALVAVVGDLNDFEFSPALTTLKGPEPALRELADTLPKGERYTYVFDGNGQTLDHQLASTTLRQRLLGYDVVHVNSEFADQISDHDPSLARYAFGALPSQPTYLPLVWR